MKTNKKTLLTAACLLIGTGIQAQNLTEKLDLPEWTRDLSASVSYTTDNIDIENSGIDGVDSQGVNIELANSYELTNGFLTQSALMAKFTDADEEIVNIDNQSIGLTQRIIRPMPMGRGFLMPSLGLGLHYGGLEFNEFDEDQNYLLINAEAKVSYDTQKGFAPFVKYSYGVGDLQDTENDLELSTFSAGVSVVF